jgi:hypothetical protein
MKYKLFSAFANWISRIIVRGNSDRIISIPILVAPEAGENIDSIVDAMDSNELFRWVTRIRNLVLGLDNNVSLPEEFIDSVVMYWYDLDFEKGPARESLKLFLRRYFELIREYAKPNHKIFKFKTSQVTECCCWQKCHEFVLGGCLRECCGCSPHIQGKSRTEKITRT